MVKVVAVAFLPEPAVVLHLTRSKPRCFSELQRCLQADCQRLLWESVEAEVVLHINAVGPEQW